PGAGTAVTPAPTPARPPAKALAIFSSSSFWYRFSAALIAVSLWRRAVATTFSISQRSSAARERPGPVRNSARKGRSRQAVISRYKPPAGILLRFLLTGISHLLPGHTRVTG